ncbi:2-hydroxyacid dehydrogenase [Microbacterium sediminicola]|uniref:2-hydroxyacid dehydrogenase n=1 Tax=Microbacterium sediminicola TaxID=415210 RepID=A0ABP4UEU6_9MICO
MSSDIQPLVVTVPSATLLDDLTPAPEGVEILEWDMRDPAPRARLDIVVPPYMRGPRVLKALAGLDVGLVQGQSIGFDGIAENLPAGNVFANAASVHEASTAELAVALTLAAQRELPRFVRAQDAARWDGPGPSGVSVESLADRRVLLVGFGGVGKGIAVRLAGFEAEVTAVASRGRVEEGIQVHAMSDIQSLLPAAEIVILSLPATAETVGIVDDAFLSALPDGALIVNVGRGPLVDTAALIDHVTRGRIRAALDVMVPEPLPSDHALWTLPGVILTPHVGGASSAMRPRIAKLVCTQIERMRAGEEPLNVVIRN